MLVFLCKYANFIDYSNKKESVNVILIITIIVLNVLVLKMILVLSIQVKKRRTEKRKKFYMSFLLILSSTIDRIKDVVFCI